MDMIVIDSITALEAAEMQERQNIAMRIATNSTYGAIASRESSVTNTIQEITLQGIADDVDRFVESYHPTVKPVSNFTRYEAILNRTKEESLELFAQLESKCKNDGPLYIQDFDEVELFQFKRFEDFLIHFVLERNYEGDSHGPIITADKNGEDQCQYQRNRSLGDLYRIVLAYYPEASITEVAKTLVTGPSILQMLYCPHIRKIVFVNKNYKSYGCTFKEEMAKWKDGYRKESDRAAENSYVYGVIDSIQTPDYANLLD